MPETRSRRMSREVAGRENGVGELARVSVYAEKQERVGHHAIICLLHAH